MSSHPTYRSDPQLNTLRENPLSVARRALEYNARCGWEGAGQRAAGARADGARRRLQPVLLVRSSRAPNRCDVALFEPWAPSPQPRTVTVKIRREVADMGGARWREQDEPGGVVGRSTLPLHCSTLKYNARHHGDCVDSVHVCFFVEAFTTCQLTRAPAHALNQDRESLLNV